MILNHLALTVSDRTRSAAFYGEHFGMTERMHEDDHMLVLRAHGCLLTLSEGVVPRALPNTNHFGFQAPNRDAVHQAREQFRLAGVTETEWQDDGMVRVQVLDPDGYRVELFGY